MADPNMKAELKAAMLCHGVSVSPGTSLRLDPTFIHGAVFLLDGSEVVNTSVWSWPREIDPVSRDELEIPLVVETAPENDEGEPQLEVHFRGFECSLDVLGLTQTLSSTKHAEETIGDWFSLHSPTTVFATPVRQCVYIATDQPCTYCTFESGKVRRLTSSEFRQGLELVRLEVPGVAAVALGGGTPTLADMGARYYGELAREAAAMGLSTSIEIVPPPDGPLRAMLSEGVDSLISSIEVWGDDPRSMWCLGKSTVAKDEYLRCWDSALEMLGAGRVSSVLLVGTEPLESTLEGAAELIGRGVIPTLIPLRWYPSARFSRWQPVSPEDYAELAIEVAALLSTAGLSPAAQPGCTACGGCSLEGSLVAVSLGER